ncbi:hypothetical protein [Hymenobacter actinosclerus]|uniref:Outer membrane protein beta-barrel domain-containing protein n=1 Tax=Hymenobacter actinosclerus TaxID=82805 RepID=A0A1I0F031_9BACT|nr:hypothetical protein [Hymenobacter actinosclerus]SET51196.1 hypothetical protein SAMN04487998_2063 [Hymenobacter actinosclerus]
MKFVYLTLALAGVFGLATQAQAQQTASTVNPLWRVAIGSSLNGSGDYQVLKTHVEYAPLLGAHLRSVSRLAYVGSSHPITIGGVYHIPQSYHAANLEQELHWLPFGANRTVEFGVGGGGFVGYSKSRSYTSYGYSEYAGYFSVPDNYKGLHVGYIASLYLDFALNQERTWRLGGRLAFQNDNHGTTLPGSQVQLSRAW